MFGRNVLCLVDFNKFICVHINSIHFLNKKVKENLQCNFEHRKTFKHLNSLNTEMTLDSSVKRQIYRNQGEMQIFNVYLLCLLI